MYNWERTFSQWLMYVLTALTLAACGGGGDGDKVLPRESDFKLSAVISNSSPRPNSTATITATVLSPSNDAVANAIINFSVSGPAGTGITSSAATNASGLAQATLTTGSGTGTGTITVKYIDADGRTAIVGIPFRIVEGNNILLSASKTSVLSGTGDAVVLTAFVTDSGGGAVENVEVTFSVPDGSLDGGSKANTDADGKAIKTFKPSTTDRSNKTVTVIAAVKAPSGGDTTDQITLDVVGTNIELSISPSTSVTLNDTITATATLKDGNGAAIPGVTISFSSPGNNPIPASAISNASGQASSSIQISSASSSIATVSASGLGSSASQTLDVSGVSFRITAPTEGSDLAINTPHVFRAQWLNTGVGIPGKTIFFSTSSGTLSAPSAITNADGIAEVTLNSPFAGPVNLKANTSAADGSLTALRSALLISTTPATTSAQAFRTTVLPNGETEIIATVLDANENPVKGKVVAFNICAGGTSGSVQPTATTNASGKATVTFKATSVSSANNGVVIRAEVQDSAVNTGTCDAVDGKHARLTVGGEAATLTVGAGRDIMELSTTTYSLPHTVTVADANGSPLPGKPVTLSLVSLDYRKGQYGISAQNTWVVFNPSAICANEDSNLNGRMDAGEDINLNGTLEPGTPATLSATSVTTDNFGFANFTVNYPKSLGSWVKVRVRASTTVSGTESFSTRDFILPIANDDAKVNDGPPPGGIDSPFGLAAVCSDPN